MATIKSSGGTYTTVALWEADTDNDLTGLGEVIGEIYDVNPTAALTIAGATNTSATDFRHLTVNSAYRHAGVYSTGKAYITANATPVVELGEAFARVTYWQAESSRSIGAATFAISAASCRIEQCISNGDPSSSSADSHAGVNISSGGTNALIRNLVAHRSVNGIYVNTPTGVEVDNSTLVANRKSGIASTTGLAVTVKNTYSGGNATNSYVQGGTVSCPAWSFTTSMSSDATARTGVTASVAYSTANFTNVTAGSEDVHLVSGSALIDQGTDLSASFTVDIDGVTRSGTWDVGADEFVAAAAGIPPLVMAPMQPTGWAA